MCGFRLHCIDQERCAKCSFSCHRNGIVALRVADDATCCTVRARAVNNATALAYVTLGLKKRKRGGEREEGEHTPTSASHMIAHFDTLQFLLSYEMYTYYKACT